LQIVGAKRKLCVKPQKDAIDHFPPPRMSQTICAAKITINADTVTRAHIISRPQEPAACRSPRAWSDNAPQPTPLARLWNQVSALKLDRLQA
jgi:hypothetical protein